MKRVSGATLPRGFRYAAMNCVCAAAPACFDLGVIAPAMTSPVRRFGGLAAKLQAAPVTLAT